MASTSVLAWVFSYLPAFISQILGLVYRMVLILNFDCVTLWKPATQIYVFFSHYFGFYSLYRAILS